MGTRGSARDLVLVGGGPAHLQVLCDWRRMPPPRVRLTLVVDAPQSIDGARVPAFVAGQIDHRELEIDLRPQARQAGARLLEARVVGIDAERRRIRLHGRPPLGYTVASLDVGATLQGLELPGLRAHALPTRPRRRFLERVPEILERARRRPGATRIVVVGGATATELAFAFCDRLRTEGAHAHVLLVQPGTLLRPGVSPRLVRRIERRLGEAGIGRVQARVVGAERDALCLEGGGRLAFDALVWATDASPRSWLRGSGVPIDAAGRVCVRPTLQVQGQDALFAVGDSACLAGSRAPAGAVCSRRAGRRLRQNLIARLRGQPLRRFRPTRVAGTLLDLGNAQALGSLGGVVIEAHWLWRWKQRLERIRAEHFRAGALGGRAQRRSAVSVAQAPGAGEAPAADAPAEDAALSSERLGVSIAVRAVRAVSDLEEDPFRAGEIAALDALGAAWARGIEPTRARALVELPETDALDAERILHELLEGARAALGPLGVAIQGERASRGARLRVGFVLLGAPPGAHAALDPAGLAPGDRLVLTKPLGTGVLLHADREGRLPSRWAEPLFRSLRRPVAEASRIAHEVGAAAVARVTTHGLARRLLDVLSASKMNALLDLTDLPVLPGTPALFARGIESPEHRANVRGCRGLWIHPQAMRDPTLELLFDPQLVGPLLLGLPKAIVAETLARLHAAGDRSAAEIGFVTPSRGERARIDVVATSRWRL